MQCPEVPDSRKMPREVISDAGIVLENIAENFHVIAILLSKKLMQVKTQLKTIFCYPRARRTESLSGLADRDRQYGIAEYGS